MDMSDQWQDLAEIFSHSRELVEKTVPLSGHPWETAVYSAMPHPDGTWRQTVVLVNPKLGHAHGDDYVELLFYTRNLPFRAHFVIECHHPSNRSNAPLRMITPTYEAGKLTGIKVEPVTAPVTQFAGEVARYTAPAEADQAASRPARVP